MKSLPEIVSTKSSSTEDLMALPGVNAVDVGYKYVKGKRTDEVCIRVHVDQKKKTVPAKEKIPETINGIKTDVIERKIYPLQFGLRKKLSDISLQADNTNYSTIKGGISIGPDRAIGGYVFAGTLGCIVRDNATNNPMLLSNFHVMCVDNGWHTGDQMDQPSRVDGGTHSDNIGNLSRAVLSDHVDGAISTLSGRPFSCQIVDIGYVAGTTTAVLNSAVRKRGRTTLLTYGFVDSIAATVKLDYGDGIGERTLHDQVSIRPDAAHNSKFSDHGDSGSVVVDNSRKVIGLLYAGSDDGFAYINPISYVLSELNIKMCKGRTKKIEVKEFKDHKEIKSEKIERKEFKEHKEFKYEKLEKIELKDKLEFEGPKRIFEHDPKGIVENQPPGEGFDPAGPSFPNAPGFMGDAGSYSSFIPDNLRPDLSQGALSDEDEGDC